MAAVLAFPDMMIPPPPVASITPAKLIPKEAAELSVEDASPINLIASSSALADRKELLPDKLIPCAFVPLLPPDPPATPCSEIFPIPASNVKPFPLIPA